MSLTTEQVWEAFHLPLQQFIRRRVPDEHGGPHPPQAAGTTQPDTEITKTLLLQGVVNLS